jgi:uncharacterized protein YeaO (DUF488 family)
MIGTKRAYEPPAPGDGHRVLIDRLWPRGLAKDAARIDEWLKDLAPSNELRQWFGHDPARFPDFRVRYQRELANETAEAQLDALARRARQGPVTLVYAAHDELHNNAAVLAELLKKRLARAKRNTIVSKRGRVRGPASRTASEAGPGARRRGGRPRSSSPPRRSR